jgi:hypothetical protein
MTHKSGLLLEKTIEKPVRKTAACPHFWLIEPALGPTSRGSCKYCGQKKIFLNIVENNQPKENLSRFFGKDEVAESEAEEVEAEDDSEDE